MAAFSVTVPAHNLNLTSYAPAVTASDHQTVDVPKHDIDLTSYAPKMGYSGTILKLSQLVAIKGIGTVITLEQQVLKAGSGNLIDFEQSIKNSGNVGTLVEIEQTVKAGPGKFSGLLLS